MTDLHKRSFFINTGYANHSFPPVLLSTLSTVLSGPENYNRTRPGPQVFKPKPDASPHVNSDDSQQTIYNLQPARNVFYEMCFIKTEARGPTRLICIYFRPEFASAFGLPVKRWIILAQSVALGLYLASELVMGVRHQTNLSVVSHSL